MSPPLDPFYRQQRRLRLLRDGLCVNNPAHGPARPMRLDCQACADQQAIRNARNNPRRKGLRKVQGES